MFFRFAIFFSCFCFVHAKTVEQMSLKEKVGQMFMVYFNGEEAGEIARHFIQDQKVGGFCLYKGTNGLSDPDQVKKLTAGLQNLVTSEIPLLLAVDQEGGLVQTLQNGFVDFPGNDALFRAGDQRLAFYSSKSIAEELLDVGINFNLAPVVDVNNNPNNPIIGVRSFGSDPEKVAAFARASLNGYQFAKLPACLKHFPGHGDVTVDSHLDLPVVDKTLEELFACELYPFERLAKWAPAIMTAHILFPKVDPDHPATFSPVFLKEILRNQIGFEGVIITDSLLMKGALSRYESLGKAAIEAILAGNDIILISGGISLQNKVGKDRVMQMISSAMDAVYEAALNGTVPKAQINASVTRILTLKNQIQKEPCSFSKEAHEKIAKKIAEDACQVIETNGFKFKEKKLIAFVPARIQHSFLESGLSKNVSDVLFIDEATTLEEFWKFMDQTDAEGAIFCSVNTWKSPDHTAMLRHVCANFPTLFIATCDEKDLDLGLGASMKIATHGPSKYSFDWIDRLLRGM